VTASVYFPEVRLAAQTVVEYLATDRHQELCTAVAVSHVLRYVQDWVLRHPYRMMKLRKREPIIYARAEMVRLGPQGAYDTMVNCSGTGSDDLVGVRLWLVQF
jgi:hypothetical protein